MLVAGFQHGVERDLQRLDIVAANAEQPWARLVAMVEACIGDNGELVESRLEWLELWRAAVRDPELRVACTAVYHAWGARFTDVITEGVRSGQFHLTQPVEAVRTVLFAIIDGLTVPFLLNEAVDRRDIATATFRWLADAVGLEQPPANSFIPSSRNEALH
jgi:hypothetical protein